MDTSPSGGRSDGRAGAGEGSSQGELYSIKPGSICLIKEVHPKRAFEIFTQIVNGEKAAGECISRVYPYEIKKRYGVRASFVWLSGILEKDSENNDPEKIVNVVDPANIARLNYTATRFLRENKNSVLLLEGIDYLLAHNDFDTILRFIHLLRDSITVSGGRLILSVDPNAIDGVRLNAISKGMQEL